MSIRGTRKLQAALKTPLRRSVRANIPQVGKARLRVNQPTDDKISWIVHHSRERLGHQMFSSHIPKPIRGVIMGEAGGVGYAYPPVGAVGGYMGEAPGYMGDAATGGTMGDTAPGGTMGDAAPGGTWLNGCVIIFGPPWTWKTFAASAGGTPGNEGSNDWAFPQICW